MKLQESNISDLILHAGNSKTVKDFLKKVKEEGLASGLSKEELIDFYNNNKSIAEVLPKSADAGEYIKDFEKSKAPQFKGKSKKKRREMAVAAFMAANKGGMKKEDILQAVKEVLAEKKATYCGRCGHTHVKGTPCPRPFKEGLSVYGDDAYFVAPNRAKMKKEEILKAIKEVLAEGTVEINTTDGTEKSATPEQRQQIQNARRAGASISYRKKGDLGEDIDLGHQDDEPHMIKSELYKIAKYALELYKMVDQFEGKGEVDFPAWWQSKITKATSMISSAKHYLEFELTEPAMDQAVVGAEAPINEGNLGHNELASLEPEGRFWIVTYRTMDGKKEKVFTDEDEARAFMGTVSEAKKKLDPVGKEDKDIDNDGDVDKTDKYLKKRRVKIGQAIASHKK